MTFSTKQITGTGVAIVTPFREDGSIDFRSFARLIDNLIENHINYLVVLGTTGESATLSQDEKRAVIDFAVDHVSGRVPVVAGVGGNNTRQVVSDLQSHPYEGVSAILSVAPYYNKPSQEGIFRHYKDIASSSSLPIILYNVPGRTGVNMTAETTLRLAHEFPQIVAVKEASGDFTQVMKILRDKPKDFLVISGDDMLTLPLISIGASGVISVIANALPNEFAQMVQLALDKKIKKSRTIHFHLLDMMELLFKEGSPGGIKAALHAKGLIEECFRLPVVAISRDTYTDIKTELTRVQNLNLTV